MIESVCPHFASPSGHPLPMEAVALCGLSATGHRTISYQRVCPDCRQQLQAQGLLLSTERARHDWLIWGRGLIDQNLRAKAA